MLAVSLIDRGMATTVVTRHLGLHHTYLYVLKTKRHTDRYNQLLDRSRKELKSDSDTGNKLRAEVRRIEEIEKTSSDQDSQTPIDKEIVLAFALADQPVDSYSQLLTKLKEEDPTKYNKHQKLFEYQLKHNRQFVKRIENIKKIEQEIQDQNELVNNIRQKVDNQLQGIERINQSVQDRTEKIEKIKNEIPVEIKKRTTKEEIIFALALVIGSGLTKAAASLYINRAHNYLSSLKGTNRDKYADCLRLAVQRIDESPSFEKEVFRQARNIRLKKELS